MSRTDEMTEFEQRLVAEAEADLDRLLSIEPSAEFAARVRARVAAERTVRPWNWSRLLVPLVAAAGMVLVVTLATTWNERDAERPLASARHDDIVLPEANVNRRPSDVPVTSVAHARPTLRRAIALPQVEPEIIIDPAITEAIRRLALAARNSTLDGSKGESIAAPDSASETLPIAGELDVPELVLKPADETGGQ